MSGEKRLAGGVRPSPSATARMWCGPAPQQTPKYATPISLRFPREVLELVAVADERVERRRERPVSGDDVTVRVAQRLEARLLVGRAVGDGQRGDVAGDTLADLREQRQHRRGATDAVEADDVGTGVLEPRARVLGRPPLAGRGILVDGEGDDGGKPRPPDHLERDERLFPPRERLADDEVDTRIHRPRDLLLEHRSHRLPRRVVPDEHVRIADVAGEQRSGLVRDTLRDRERAAVHLLEQVLLPDDAELLAMRVVGERLDDVRARMHELAVELRDEPGLLEHDLRDERTRLQIPAALELEEVPLRADHRPLGESIEQAELLRHQQSFRGGVGTTATPVAIMCRG